MLTDNEKEELRSSPEFKKKIDNFMQEFSMSYEDLRVEKGTKRINIKGRFVVDDIDEDITLISLDNGLPVIVEINEISKKVDLAKGNKIKAIIFSNVNQNGMTSEWFFEKIKKL